MVFIGQPNLFVRISNKYIQRITGKKGFYFDENGRFKTDNEVLINALKQYFQSEETQNEQAEKTEETLSAEKKKVYKCKQCDFETDNIMGKLLAHIRKEHPKEG